MARASVPGRDTDGPRPADLGAGWEAPALSVADGRPGPRIRAAGAGRPRRPAARPEPMPQVARVPPDRASGSCAAATTNRGAPDGAVVRADIARLIDRQSFTPLTGLAGEPLVNVLALTLALGAGFPVPTPSRAP